MIVRIRLGTGASRQRALSSHHAAEEQPLHAPLPVHPAAPILTRLSVLMIVIALWRLGLDLQLIPWFFVPGGIFSHWQVWFALAVPLQGAAFMLNKRVRRQALDSFPSILDDAMNARPQRRSQLD